MEGFFPLRRPHPAGRLLARVRGMSMTSFARAAATAAIVFSAIGTAQAVPERLSQDARDARARLAANAGGALVERGRKGSSYMSVRAAGARPLMVDNATVPA